MTRQDRVAPAKTDFRTRFTAAEFVRMLDTGAFADMKVELMRGELERMNPPQSDHSRYQTDILLRLAAVVGPSRILGEIGIDLGDDTILAFDAVVLVADVTDNRFLTPGDVLVGIEIATNTLARDTGPKRLAYARAGIPHYWVVDGRQGVTHVYGEPVDGDYAEAGTVRFGAPLAVPATGRTIILD